MALFNINVCVKFENESLILSLLQKLNVRINDMALDLTQLLAKVTEMETVQQGMVALLDEVAQWIRDLPPNPDQSVIDDLTARVEALRSQGVDAVVRNTDVDPTPPTP